MPSSSPHFLSPSQHSSPFIPSSMHAWTYHSRGSPRQILTLSTLPTPSPSSLTPSTLLIRISHCALNPDGPLIMSFPTFFRPKPCIPELEFSGTVVATGASTPTSQPTNPPTSSSTFSFARPSQPSQPILATNPVTTLPIGTEVVGWFSPIETLFYKRGALAEYVIADRNSVVIKPKNVSWEEAAGVTGVGQTAAKMIKVAGLGNARGSDEAGERAGGKKVLVNGGSTGVGMLVVQLLKLRGCDAVATCSGGNVELVVGLGADGVVDYRKHEPVWMFLAEAYKGRPFDVILDTAGTQELYLHSPAYLKEDGPYVNVGAFGGIVKTITSVMYNWFWPTLLGGVPRKYYLHSTLPDRKVEEELMELLDEGKIRVVVEKVYPMEDVLEGYNRVLSQRVRGKQIVNVEGR